MSLYLDLSLLKISSIFHNFQFTDPILSAMYNYRFLNMYLHILCISSYLASSWRSRVTVPSENEKSFYSPLIL